MARQCAAVSTQSGAMREPPHAQVILSLPKPSSAMWGNSMRSVGSPPDGAEAVTVGMSRPHAARSYSLHTERQLSTLRSRSTLAGVNKHDPPLLETLSPLLGSLPARILLQDSARGFSSTSPSWPWSQQSLVVGARSAAGGPGGPGGPGGRRRGSWGQHTSGTSVLPSGKPHSWGWPPAAPPTAPPLSPRGGVSRRERRAAGQRGSDTHRPGRISAAWKQLRPAAAIRGRVSSEPKRKHWPAATQL